MNSKPSLSIYQKQYLTQWCILLGCLFLLAYFIYDERHRAAQAVSVDDLSHVVGKFTQVECNERVFRGVASIDFVFEANDGKIIEGGKSIDSWIYCSDSIIEQLVTSPLSRKAELWLYQDFIIGIHFGGEEIRNIPGALSSYNVLYRSNKVQYFLLILILGINFRYWYSKWKMLDAC